MSFLRYPVAAITGLALLLAVLGFWPNARIIASNVSAPIAQTGLTMTIDLDAPTEVRLGTGEIVRLTTKLSSDTGSTPDLLAKAQTVVTVDSACVAVDPPGETLQAAILGQSEVWVWQLQPLDDALGPCEVDVVVRLRPQTEDQIVWVKQLQIQVASVMGLPVPTAQALGLTVSVIGFLVLALIQLKLHYKVKL
jgi:hypothetical protein